MQHVQCALHRLVRWWCQDWSCQHGFPELHSDLVWTSQSHILSLHLSVNTRHDTCQKNCQAQPHQSSSEKTHLRPEIIVSTSRQRKSFMRLFDKCDYTSSPCGPTRYWSWHRFGSVQFACLRLWWRTQTSTKTSDNPPVAWKLSNNVTWRNTAIWMNLMHENVFKSPEYIVSYTVCANRS